MNDNSVCITGLTRHYPEFKYSTKEMIDLLGNKLTEKVKENVFELGVENRYFINPLDCYISESNPQKKLKTNAEPISDLAATVAQKCLSDLGLKNNDITCVVAAFEDNDFLSPGLSSILLTKMGLSKFIPHYNIQGMACSTLPKLLELGKNLIHNKNDKILFVISGCNSGWYLPHLKDGTGVLSPKEISKDKPDREEQISKWVSTMFSFLFGDGVAAFVIGKSNYGDHAVKIGKITQALIFDDYDYRKACVRLVGNTSTHMYEYELSASSDILKRSLEYSKKVLARSFGNDADVFDEQQAKSFLSEQKKVMIHTGSLKILDGFKNTYNLDYNQIQESYQTLKEYGNLTGVSLPTVLGKAMTQKNSMIGKSLLVGITMGFGLDIVEIENT